MSQHYESLGCLHDMFSRQAQKTPDSIAIVTDDGTKMTMREVDNITNCLAQIFIHKYHVGIGQPVGIYMEKSPEYVLVYIAALKAGGAYFVLDVSYPLPLLESILDESKPPVVCTKPVYSAGLPANTPRFIFDDDWLENISEMSLNDVKWPKPTLDDMAYLVYSSGTTGKPKGICCPHRGAVFSYNWRHENYPFVSGDRVACNVFFTWEMLRSMLKGIPLYIIPDDVIYEPPALCEFIEKHRITEMLFTPSLLQTVMDTMNEKVIRSAFQSMKKIWLCGEVVTVSLLKQTISTAPWIQILNLYSISECHDVSVTDLSKWYTSVKANLESEKNSIKFAPAGQLLPEVKVVIMDENWNLQPIGVSGEAIETTLNSLSCVNTCSVTIQGQEGTDKHVVAYVVLQEKITRKELRAALKRRLPFYMIPSYFVYLDRLPLLVAAGKVDKKALPPVNLDTDVIEVESLPKTPTEQKLADIWREILNLKAIDIQESFFDLGGHSLLAARLLNRVSDQFGRRLTMQDLFKNSTVENLAKLLQGMEGQTNGLQALDLAAEVEKHDLKDAVMDLYLRAFWRSLRWGDRWRKGCVLLTGSTGFVGSFILRELLLSSELHIICLVRDSPEEAPEERLRRILDGYGSLDAQIEGLLKERVTIFKGDVALKRMGLNEDDYQFLSYDVDFVIHAAAYVNLIYPYEALHGCNVLGAQNVLLFCYSNKIKPLHYIRIDEALAMNESDKNLQLLDRLVDTILRYMYGITHKLDKQFVKHQESEFSMEWNPNIELSSACGVGAERATTCT